jgi:hypothetical protein
MQEEQSIKRLSHVLSISTSYYLDMCILSGVPEEKWDEVREMAAAIKLKRKSRDSSTNPGNL